ncbi:MAG TPA: hypothetical protein VMV17_25560 [Streptosporangiaceae bacterium]|jgi:hypothetical protein|nr:hypothetical protein [Streptosporangiaceae bacterium]
MLDVARLEPLQASLGADGYLMEAREEGGRIDVRIRASDDACADCLVPKPIMRGILGQVLGVAEDIIDLTYPAELPG